MKTTIKSNTACFIGLMLIFLGTFQGKAQVNPGGGSGGGGSGPSYTPLASWSFSDSINWKSDQGYSPVSYANISYSYLGSGASLVVGNQNPAWLQYNVVERNGTTNFTANNGTVMFWFAPNWSSVCMGGTGPGEYGRLIEAGAYTTNSSLGWWSIYVDAAGSNIMFSAQTNNYSGSYSNYLTAPINWKTNYFHLVTVTYTPSNTALYLDGSLATTGPGISVYPNSNVLSNGFYIGSDNTGVFQSKGLFNNLFTYNTPLDGGSIQSYFNIQFQMYLMSPWNTVMFRINSANSYPSNTLNSYNAISGPGCLQWQGAAPVVYGSNACQVWITNISTTFGTNGAMNVVFTIEGGADGYAYDLFATEFLKVPISTGIWAWMGQGYHGNTYMVNVSSPTAFMLLGTPQDSDGDGLTDAYELLVSHTNPNNPNTSGDGISDSDKVLLGLNPSTAYSAIPLSPTIQTCPQ